ncbi:MAG: homoserine O-acetyltransferase, partial [Bacteroidota bacterium]
VNAFSYFFLSKAMDAHHVGRGRNTVEEALQTITAKTLVISISSDLLFPPKEQQWLAEHVQNGVHTIIDSDYGHDGFLLEYDKIGQAINKFIK